MEVLFGKVDKPPSLRYQKTLQGLGAFKRRKEDSGAPEVRARRAVSDGVRRVWRRAAAQGAEGAAAPPSSLPSRCAHAAFLPPPPPDRAPRQPRAARILSLYYQVPQWHAGRRDGRVGLSGVWYLIEAVVGQHREREREREAPYRELRERERGTLSRVS